MHRTSTGCPRSMPDLVLLHLVARADDCLGHDAPQDSIYATFGHRSDAHGAQCNIRLGVTILTVSIPCGAVTRALPEVDCAASYKRRRALPGVKITRNIRTRSSVPCYKGIPVTPERSSHPRAKRDMRQLPVRLAPSTLQREGRGLFKDVSPAGRARGAML